MLNGIIKGRQKHHPRVVLTGVNGIGKSSFAAAAPKPIFIGTEDGTAHLDIERFPTPHHWEDVLSAISALTIQPHDYETLALDTLDAAEPMLWQYICKRDKQESIEGYGYGKGYTAAVDEWRNLLAQLERLRKSKPMNIILIAHSWIRTFKNPEGEDFDRYEMKLNAKASGLINDWADCVLFANYETFAVQDKKTKRVKGVDNGARLIYTERRAAYDAKNRYELPQSMPLSWSEFAAGVAAHGSVSAPAVREEILRKAKLLGGEIETGVPSSLTKAGDNAAMLSKLNNFLNAKLLERGTTEAGQ